MFYDLKGVYQGKNELYLGTYDEHNIYIHSIYCIAKNLDHFFRSIIIFTWKYFP